MAAERAGVPALAIMTTKFVGAAELMARALGADGFPIIVIEHPISSASPEALGVQAAQAMSAGLAILAGSGHAPGPDGS